MRPRPSARLGAATFVAAALVALTAVPASAVGAGGVEMTVHLGRSVDDRLLLEVGDEPVVTTVTLTNLSTDPKSVDVYAVDARVDGASVALGADESASWLGFERTGFDLDPDEARTFMFTTDRASLPEGDGGGRHVALVMELTQGASVVVRAASVLRVQGTHALPPFTMALIAVASLLLVAAGAALAHEVRRRHGARSDRKERTAGERTGAATSP